MGDGTAAGYSGVGRPVSVRFLVGDVRETLAQVPDGSVQCVVTSPPYFNLRSYLATGHTDKALEFGTEATPDEYIDNLVGVFCDVRRVLREDGVVFLNLGDSYAGGGKGGNPPGSKWAGFIGSAARQKAAMPAGAQAKLWGMKPKDRLMIPARVALALQSDGWWIRDEIVWHKPRTTPFPANDRTVAAHEMVYLLTKRARYFFDWAAIEEPAAYAGTVRNANKVFRRLGEAGSSAAQGSAADSRVLTVRDTRRKRSVWSINPSPYKEAHFATMPAALATICIQAGSRIGNMILDPFGGAGTTALAAMNLGRSAILCELNPAYVRIAKRRLGVPFDLADWFAENTAARQRDTATWV